MAERPMPASKQELCSLADFQQSLLEQQTDYLLAPGNDNQEAHFQFIGHFNEQDVIWHAQLLTLQQYNRLDTENLNTQQMIIQYLQPLHYHIQIVLKLKQINPASIIMAIKMVRQYKGLKLGRHNWN